MNKNYLVQYFLSKCNELNTFELDSWLDNNGYPKFYGNGYIKSTVKIPAGTVSQSLFMASGEKLFMGLLDCDPGIGNDDLELDLEYTYSTRELTLNYNNKTLQELYYYDPQIPPEQDYISIDIILSESEEEHFQDSLIEAKMMTFEEEQKVLNFCSEVRKRFYEKKVPIQ